MKFYKRKPTVVEAIQLAEDNFDEIKNFVGEYYQGEHYKNEYDFLKHENPEGIFLKRDKIAYIGDYIVKDVDGLFYPYKEILFKKIYEEI